MPTNRSKCSTLRRRRFDEHNTCFTLTELRRIANYLNINYKGINRASALHKKITDTFRDLDEIGEHEWIWTIQAKHYNDSMHDVNGKAGVLKTIQQRAFLTRTDKPGTAAINTSTFLSSGEVRRQMKSIFEQYKESTNSNLKTILIERDERFLSNFMKKYHKKKNWDYFVCPINVNDSHWVVILVSYKDRSIEFFDSFARPPEHYIHKVAHKYNYNISHIWHNFLKLNEDELLFDGHMGTPFVNNVVVQFGGSQCGVFILNYVDLRINGFTFAETIQAMGDLRDEGCVLTRVERFMDPPRGELRKQMDAIRNEHALKKRPAHHSSDDELIIMDPPKKIRHPPVIIISDEPVSDERSPPAKKKKKSPRKRSVAVVIDLTEEDPVLPVNRKRKRND